MLINIDAIAMDNDAFFTGNVHEEALGNVFLRKYPLYSSKDCQ